MATITAELTSGTQVILSDGRHTWRGDEPREIGGTDTGPTPYELLVASLAACACITLALYCRHKGIRLKSVNATYHYGRVHADDCEACDDPKTGFIDQISGYIRIAGTLDDAQRKRLAQVAERCPVHKTLARGVKMIDRVEFA